MLSVPRYIGKISLNILEQVGAFSLFLYKIMTGIFTLPLYVRLIFQQLMTIGYFSIPVVSMTAFFSGAVLALQSYDGFSRFSAEQSIAVVVVLSITRELGPVLSGLMVASRVGASIAAEIGTMRVTEQIDALIVLSTNPIKYLIIPRIIASIITLPCLVLVADIFGVFGGYVVSVYKLGFNSVSYLISTFDYLKLNDVISGLIKASVFGFLITFSGCYHGYFSKKGARGVGVATTSAVVHSAIMILISDYIMTELFFTG